MQKHHCPIEHHRAVLRVMNSLRPNRRVEMLGMFWFGLIEAVQLKCRQGMRRSGFRERGSSRRCTLPSCNTAAPGVPWLCSVEAQASKREPVWRCSQWEVSVLQTPPAVLLNGSFDASASITEVFTHTAPTVCLWPLLMLARYFFHCVQTILELANF